MTVIMTHDNANAAGVGVPYTPSPIGKHHKAKTPFFLFYGIKRVYPGTIDHVVIFPPPAPLHTQRESSSVQERAQSIREPKRTLQKKYQEPAAL